MANISFIDELTEDQRIIEAIERGVVLASHQGYDTQDISFFVKKPRTRLLHRATAMILEEDRSIAVGIDAENPNYSLVSQLVVHEINHLEREKHSCIETLEEVLVSEGLAQMAEKKAGFELVSVSSFQSDADRQTITDAMRGDFNTAVLGDNRDPVKDYGYYFQGRGDLRNFAGYALGLEIVETYMTVTGETIQEATKAPASTVAGIWKNKQQMAIGNGR